MIFRNTLQEQQRAERAVTRAQQRAFAQQINRLIRQTGKLERDKVEEVVRLLQRSRADLQSRILGLPKGRFTRDAAEQLKAEVERLMAEFAQRGTDSLLRSQGEFAELGQTFTEELIKSQIKRPPMLGISPTLVENAATRSADLIRTLSQRQIGRASDILNRSVITGRSTFETAQDLGVEFNKGIAQMETIARTEMLGIHGQVQFAELLAMEETSPGLRKQWITVKDGRQRDTHDAAHLQARAVRDTFNVGRAKLRFPRDPAGGIAAEVVNCFPAGTEVQGTFIGAMRAMYSGPCIELTTQAGRSLRVTPNHPVLTANGFAPAERLREGDYLICHAATVERASGRHHVEKAPALIEDAFRSLAEFGAHRQVSRSGDFHGDGRFLDEHVDVVGPVGKLLGDLQSGPSEIKGNLVLKGSSVGQPHESGPRPGQLKGQRVLHASPGFPGRSALSFNSPAPLALETSPFQPLRLGPAAKIHASRYEMPGQSGSPDAAFKTQLLERYPRDVELDEVAQVSDFQFSGHVYDLQSPYGWIIANNFFNSNCRCTMVPDFSQVREVELPPLDPELMPPVREPLPRLSKEVERDVKKGFRSLR